MLRQGDVRVSVAFETARQMHWGESDISSMALPLFHCFGLSAGYLSSLASGHCVCLVDGVHSTSILKDGQPVSVYDLKWCTDDVSGHFEKEPASDL